MTRYGYDAVGNTTSVTDASGNVTRYAFDRLNRLASDGTYRYAYDAEGNRTAKFADTSPGGTLSVGDTDVTLYAYDQRNRLVAVSHVNAWTSTQAAGLAAFNATGTGIPGSDLELRYTYDYADRRIRKSLDADGTAGSGLASVSFAAYAGDVRTLEIARTASFPGGFLGQVIQRNFYGNGQDEMLAVDQITWNGTTPTTSTFWTFTDHQDSVRDIVSGNAADRGKVVEHRQYDSFGKVVRRTTGPAAGAPATSGVGIDFGYAGRPLEARTGLSDNRARWYEPSTGRFINEDPSGFKGGDANLFRYVGNDPLNQVDPSGLAAKWASYAGGISTSATMGSAVTPLGWSVLGQQASLTLTTLSPSVSAMAYAGLRAQPAQATAGPIFSSMPAMTATVSGAAFANVTPVATSRSNAVQPTSASPYQSVYRTEVERVTTPLAGAGFANNGWNGNAAGYGAGTRAARGWADAAGNRWNTSAGEISAYGPPPPAPTWTDVASAGLTVLAAIASRRGAPPGQQSLTRGEFLRQSYPQYTPIQRQSRIAELLAGNRVLREAGVPRQYISPALQSFEPGTLNVRVAGDAYFGLRFYGGASPALSPYLAPTFPPGNVRATSALPPGNTMERMIQYQVRPGVNVLEGRVRSNFGQPGGGRQIYVPNYRNNLLAPNP